MHKHWKTLERQIAEPKLTHKDKRWRPPLPDLIEGEVVVNALILGHN